MRVQLVSGEGPVVEGCDEGAQAVRVLVEGRDVGEARHQRNGAHVPVPLRCEFGSFWETMDVSLMNMWELKESNANFKDLREEELHWQPISWVALKRRKH